MYTTIYEIYMEPNKSIPEVKNMVYNDMDARVIINPRGELGDRTIRIVLFLKHNVNRIISCREK